MAFFLTVLITQRRNFLFALRSPPRVQCAGSALEQRLWKMVGFVGLLKDTLSTTREESNLPPFSSFSFHNREVIGQFSLRHVNFVVQLLSNKS